MRTAILIAIVLFGACESRVNAPPARSVAPPPSPPAREPEPEPEPEPVAPACAHALECCHAFVVAMPEDSVREEVACAGVEEANRGPEPEHHCRMLTDGWRQAIERIHDADASACVE